MMKFWCLLWGMLFSMAVAGQQIIVVSPEGNDRAEGSAAHPLKSVEAALQKVRMLPEKEVTVYFRGGTYYLPYAVEITPEKLAGKRLTLAAWKDEKVCISGGRKITAQWKKDKKGCWQTPVDITDFDQLYINGEKKVLARYPNYRPGEIYNGTAADAIAPARVLKWKSPEGGYIHAMHRGQWGDMHYVITGKKGDSLFYEGGHQNNRPSAMHWQYRFVENIREELDTIQEWYVDDKKKVLYYYPGENEDIRPAKVEVACLPSLIKLKGTLQNPLKGVTLKGLHFIHTSRTFMKDYEPLMRSDWCIYRGAAVFMENTEDCVVTACEFSDLGGNALFLSRYNLNNRISGNHIHHIGASAVCVVGDTSAVRSGSLNYGKFVPYEKMDLVPGPKNNIYPRQCVISDNLIHDLGLVEKQVAGVEIQLASEITVSHNSIYRVPRAAINVGDGAFGGHLIEYNDAFETVLETSDHGAFNSWGRDRFWHPDYRIMTKLVKEHPEIILLDALYTTVIRNNRFSCHHGWDIDLDDGSSNYHIYNNLCLSGGIKLREGFYRTVENNITINNSLHPHVWFSESGDVVQRNLFMQTYFPVGMNGWGKLLDYNYFPNERMLAMAQTHTDAHSIAGKIDFLDPERGDYRLPEDSEVFRIGFQNIPMDRFGVYSPALKALAEQPPFPKLIIGSTNKKEIYTWLKAKIRSIDGLGDRSACGLPDEKGVFVVDVENSALLSGSGVQKGDVIRSIEGMEVGTVEDLLSWSKANGGKHRANIIIFRNQEEIKKNISLK